MKNHYYYLFVLIFFSFNVKSQTQAPGENNPVDPTEQGPIGNEPDNQSTKLNDLLYSEIFTPKNWYSECSRF